MSTAAEAAGQQGAMRAVLDSGLEVLSDKTTVTFTLYNRAVVSDDGSVFWVTTGQTMTAVGSLHIATDRVQDEDQTIGVTQAIFTSEVLVSEFLAMAPDTMWIGSWPLGDATLKIAFSSRGRFYKPADLYHYYGNAVYPAMESQLIDSPDDLPVGPIVSNSLPIWLSQTTFAGLTVPVYSSFLVPDNVVPPYIAAHVDPRGTVALQAFPIDLWPGNAPSGDPLQQVGSSQLLRDAVTLTLYGFTAQTAQQYYSMLIAYSNVGPGETPTFGFANTPAIRDEKRTQAEIAAIAMKKTLYIEANYYLNTAEAAARRIILSAGFASFTVDPTP